MGLGVVGAARLRCRAGRDGGGGVGRGTEFLVSWAGLLRCQDRSRRADRAGACPVRVEPHPPGATPAASRYQRDDVTSQAARHVRGLIRREHHTRARIVSQGQHHRAGTGIVDPGS